MYVNKDKDQIQIYLNIERFKQTKRIKDKITKSH